VLTRTLRAIVRATAVSCRGADREQLVAQRPELVAQLGGVLEAQLLGGREHLLLERDDELLDLLARHALDLAAGTALARHLRCVAERQQLEDVGHARTIEVA